MFEVKKPGKKIKTVLAELGTNYEIKAIDSENCIYRDLKNGYDIEVSGLDNAKRDFVATVYVWETSPRTRTVETIRGIDSIDSLKQTLSSIINKYGTR